MRSMRRFLFLCVAGILLFFLLNFLYQYLGFHLPFCTTSLQQPKARVEGTKIQLQQEDGSYRGFTLRGVDMGAAMPGKFATEYGIQKDDYLRWFAQIKAMGANTVRVYTLENSSFYDAVYTFNHNNPDPLYFIQGVWVSDYTQFSHRDAYDPAFGDKLIYDSKQMVDAIHGNRSAHLGAGGNYRYTKDVSPWVIGYILGVEWEDITVVYTNEMEPDENSYTGAYFYTSADASPFEAMLAKVGDRTVAYETERYGMQHMLAFSNWPTTDPFTYSEATTEQFRKCAKVDVEHIKTTPAFLAGQFASYHVYPYYPDYLRYEPEYAGYLDENGKNNTYRAYLQKLAQYHTMPVVISEFGVPSSRGMAQRDANTGRNQGDMSETEQASALTACYRDIVASGCAGGIAFTWQDEWFKRTWNAMYAVDLLHTPYWSDYQTNEQYFGLLSFDPGKEKSVCYVDGDASEWANVSPVCDKNGVQLKMLTDEKFLYFYVSAASLTAQDKLYLPLDTTPKSGGLGCDAYGLQFDRPVDFVIALDGDESRVKVQERYCVLRAMSSGAYGIDNPYDSAPAADTTSFWNIDLLLQTPLLLEAEVKAEQNGQTTVDLSGVKDLDTYETGKLTQGNANPDAADYNSLADYCYGDNCVEIKLPWQMLNFSDPARMEIHDDYYAHYGVEYLAINRLYAGAALNPGAADTIALSPFALKGWDKKVTYHERLKPAYYALQALWTQ